MDETLVDVWYRWLGVAIASLAVLGVAADIPTRQRPDAARLATTVDAVAASDHPTTGEHPLDAEAVRLGVETVSIRDAGGVSTAPLAYQVTPVGADRRLDAILHGHHPKESFDSPAALERAADRARAHRPPWQPAEGRILVRHLTWEDVDVTLVGV